MPKSGWIIAILPLLAFSMALGAPSPNAALSFFVERHHGIEVIGHSGNQNGFLSHLYLHPPSRTAYAVAFNTDASSKSRARPRITRDVDDAVRDRLLEDLDVKRARVLPSGVRR